jgi:hypothetical protein
MSDLLLAVVDLAGLAIFLGVALFFGVLFYIARVKL